MQKNYEQIKQAPQYPFNPSQQATEVKPAHRLSKLYFSKRTVIYSVPSNGIHFVKGPSSSYNDEFPMVLAPFIKEEEFKTFMSEINTQLDKYYPCNCILYTSYVLALITCFLSLFMPDSCIQEATKFLHYVLERWNETWNPRGVFVDWRRKFWSSVIEFSVSDQVYEKMMNEMSISKEETKGLISVNIGE